MDGEIRVGETLLDYAKDLLDISQKLTGALAMAMTAKELILDEYTYKGEAAEEVQAYSASLEANVQKMKMLYDVASQYVLNTYKEHYYNEQQIIDWYLKNMG